MKTGAEIIAEERQRQIAVEGWTAEHDDTHEGGELALAALGYCFHAAMQTTAEDEGMGVETDYRPDWWPFERRLWKPSASRVRNLAIAGALIAAEIDRLQRAEKSEVAP
ncbi:MAG TPA: hypothetical protein VHC95_07030 [Opitutales bacterium]|nr:hypothetical protein [Opitutales bacterium]